MRPLPSLPRTALALVWGLFGLAFGNIYRFRVQPEKSVLPGLKAPVKVLQLSDLHYGTFIGPRMVGRWVGAALEQQADVIVITGDFLDSSLGLRPQGALLRQLSRLQAPLGVYAVFGNHDWTSLNTTATRARFADELEKIGIQVINNGGLHLRDDLYLAGTDDWWFGTQDVPAMLEGYAGGALLLLSHNPDYLPHVPPQVTLTLCGHTHGGQVRVPLLGPIKRASLYGTQFLEGWVQAAAAQPSAAEHSHPASLPRVNRGYVTHGLGVTGLPFRLGVPAEMTVFEFEAAEGV